MLGLVARHGRLVLIAGLIVGVAWPALARALEPLIVPLIALMLFLASLRIGPEAARPRLREMPRHAGLALLLQTAMPLMALAVLTPLGWHDSIVGIGVVLALAASPITGSPGLAILSGADPMPALRALVVGTVLLPLTVLPVFWFMPVFADPVAMVIAAVRLMVIIVAAGGGALLLRRVWPGVALPRAQAGLDGLMALSMGVIVIALMSAVGPALTSGEPALWWILGLVLVLNFATQLSVWAVFRGAGQSRQAPALAIVAGNRNIALFLVAVPPGMAADLLLFVGCFQIPMYLTPVTLARLYRRVTP